MMAGLRDDGFVTVQVRWRAGWHVAERGEDAGSHAMACRPATVIAWAHETVVAPLGLAPSPGACGYCVTGVSASANAVVHALSHYGLDAVVDAAIPTGGPSATDVAAGCLDRGDLAYLDGNRRNIDADRGFQHFAGPCTLEDPAYEARWGEESVGAAGADLLHESTRVTVLLGEHEAVPVVNQARAYEALLRAAGTPMVDEAVAPGIGHDVCANAQGTALLRAAFLAVPAAPGASGSGRPPSARRAPPPPTPAG
jgi:hypothetical protein